MLKKHKPYGLDENIRVAKDGGQIAKNTRKDLEEKHGKTIITKDNVIQYEYKATEKLLENE